MRVSYRHLCRTLGADLPLEAVTDRLTRNGLEVEGVLDLGARSGRLVIGRILEMRAHPNADKLTLCKVDTAGDEPLTIVCGAKNMGPGDLVVVALDGAELPGGMKIRKGKIRGETSMGMMCSPREIGWSEDAAGLLLLPEDSGHRVGEPFDALIEISVTPNRADCLSVRGVARDLAAALGLPPPAAPAHDLREAGAPAETSARVRLDAPDACPRYLGRVIRGVTVRPSPRWMQRALEAAGMRPLNNVVDVTNYVLAEWGHPLHAFDLSLVAGGEVVIRRARDGEAMTTLDGAERHLTGDDLLIADPEKPIALAGIMGGANSQILETTTDVFLECAYFRPSVVRRTSARLGISTDSSYRFERGTDAQALQAVINFAAHLIAETAGGTVAPGTLADGPGHEPAQPVMASEARVRELLGFDPGAHEMRRVLTALGFGIADTPGGFAATAPSWRHDIAQEADLVEEIGRIAGYDRIPSALPVIEMRPGLRPDTDRVADRILPVLVAAGCCESNNYGFLAGASLAPFGLADEELVRLANPLSAEFDTMRPALLPSLLANVQYNQHREQTGVRLFEWGAVFLGQGAEAPIEETQVAAVLAGARAPHTWRGKAGPADFFDAKALAEAMLETCGLGRGESVRLADSEAPGDPAGAALHRLAVASLHPGKAAVLCAADARLYAGELHPRLVAAYELKGAPVAVMARVAPLAEGIAATPEARDVPVYPGVTRDIALLADRTVAAADIDALIRKRGRPLLASAELFDVYEGERLPAGKKSVAYSLHFEAADRTLKDEEVVEALGRILDELKAKLGIELRS